MRWYTNDPIQIDTVLLNNAKTYYYLRLPLYRVSSTQSFPTQPMWLLPEELFLASGFTPDRKSTYTAGGILA